MMKLLSCLGHCFRSPIVGFYQQWAFVILHDFDSDRVVPFLFLDALNDQVRIGSRLPSSRLGRIVSELASLLSLLVRLADLVVGALSKF